MAERAHEYLYLVKSNITTMKEYSLTSKIPSFKTHHNALGVLEDTISQIGLNKVYSNILKVLSYSLLKVQNNILIMHGL